MAVISVSVVPRGSVPFMFTSMIVAAVSSVLLRWLLAVAAGGDPLSFVERQKERLREKESSNFGKAALRASSSLSASYSDEFTTNQR